MIPRFKEDTIGHFWISFGLSFKASPGAHLFTWKLVFICMWMKTNFHVKGWAPRLALKKRPKVIRKWSIEVSFIMAVICRVCQNRGMGDHVWGLLSSTCSFFCWFYNTVSYHFCTKHPFMLSASYSHTMSQMVLVLVLAWSHPCPELKSFAEICSKKGNDGKSEGFYQTRIKTSRHLVRRWCWITNLDEGL